MNDKAGYRVHEYDRRILKTKLLRVLRNKDLKKKEEQAKVIVNAFHNSAPVVKSAEGPAALEQGSDSSHGTEDPEPLEYPQLLEHVVWARTSKDFDCVIAELVRDDRVLEFTGDEFQGLYEAAENKTRGLDNVIRELDGENEFKKDGDPRRVPGAKKDRGTGSGTGEGQDRSAGSGSGPNGRPSAAAVGRDSARRRTNDVDAAAGAGKDQGPGNRGEKRPGGAGECEAGDAECDVDALQPRADGLASRRDCGGEKSLRVGVKGKARAWGNTTWSESSTSRKQWRVATSTAEAEYRPMGRSVSHRDGGAAEADDEPYGSRSNPIHVIGTEFAGGSGRGLEDVGVQDNGVVRRSWTMRRDD